MSSHQWAGRRSLFPTGIQPIQRYHRREHLTSDIKRCQAEGWELVQLDADGWSDPAAMHDRLAEAFGFPSYYGRNLDALNDVMGDVAEGHYGFSAEAPGGVIALVRYDHLAGAHPRQATQLIEILTTTAWSALTFGWPIAVLVQTDDPKITIQGPPSASIPWNPAEYGRSARET